MSSKTPQSQLNAAIRELTAARMLLEGLIQSAESFDNSEAKQTLLALERKLQELARVETQLRAELAALVAPDLLAFQVEP